MPFNGSGTFVRTQNWTSDANNNLPISAAKFDNEDNDFASGLSLCLTRDGQGVPTAGITWGLPAAKVLGLTRGSDGTVFSIGRTGGVNNPGLQLSVTDATNLAAISASSGNLQITGQFIPQQVQTGGSAPTTGIYQPLGTSQLQIAANGNIIATFNGSVAGGALTVGPNASAAVGFASIATLAQGLAGYSAINVANQNTANTAYSLIEWSDQFTSGVAALALTNSGYSGSLLTNGPTGQAIQLYSFSNVPLALGTNNIARMTIAASGAVSVIAPTSGVALTVNGITGQTSLSVTNNSTQVFAVNGTSSPTIQGYGPTAAGLVDMTPDTGSFTGTMTGLTAGVTGTIVWARVGNLMTIFVPGSFTGTSNATTCTITGGPAILAPARTQQIAAPNSVMENNTASITNGATQMNVGSSTITLVVGAVASAWTASGTKGVLTPFAFSYLLN